MPRGSAGGRGAAGAAASPGLRVSDSPMCINMTGTLPLRELSRAALRGSTSPQRCPPGPSRSPSRRCRSSSSPPGHSRAPRVSRRAPRGASSARRTELTRPEKHENRRRRGASVVLIFHLQGQEGQIYRPAWSERKCGSMTQLVGPLGGPTSVSKGRFFISTPLLTGGPGIVDRNGVYQMSAEIRGKGGLSRMKMRCVKNTKCRVVTA